MMVHKEDDNMQLNGELLTLKNFTDIDQYNGLWTQGALDSVFESLSRLIWRSKDCQYVWPKRTTQKQTVYIYALWDSLNLKRSLLIISLTPVSVH